MHTSNIKLLGPRDVFYTVTDEKTKFTHSNSTRYESIFQAQHEADNRIARGVQGVYILQAIELRTPFIDRYRYFKDARAAGKVIQFRSPKTFGDDRWQNCGPHEINWGSEPPENYRIKPEPEYEPMAMHDFVGGTFWMRQSGMNNTGTAYMLQSINRTHVGISAHGTGITYGDLLLGWEYSTDLKTWKLCRKLVPRILTAASSPHPNMQLHFKTRPQHIYSFLWVGNLKPEDLPKQEEIPDWLQGRVGFTGAQEDGTLYYMEVRDPNGSVWHVKPGEFITWDGTRFMPMTQYYVDQNLDLADAPLEPGQIEAADHIHDWFGLTYASYVVMPRVLLQSCSPAVQKQLVEAFEAVEKEESEHMGGKNWPYDGARIAVTLRNENGRFIKDPFSDYERGRKKLWTQAES
jgi:hypothetical protein